MKPSSLNQHRPTRRSLLCIFNPFSALLILTLVLIPSSYAQCDSREHPPLCCKGKQLTCFAYASSLSTVRSSFSLAYRSRSTVRRDPYHLKKCYCDEHCTRTGDCCPDYRRVCHKPVINCVVSEWGAWSRCSKTCGSGLSRRRRHVVRLAENGGQHCPVLEESNKCELVPCSSRRVGRSWPLMLPFMHQARSEVAHILPVRGNVLHATRRYDMRWDERRKLYLGRLIRANKTEQPDPDPYCVTYEVTHIKPTCQSNSLLRKFLDLQRASTSARRHSSYNYPHDRTVTLRKLSSHNRYNNAAYRRGYSASAQYNNYQPYFNSVSEPGLQESWFSAWLSHAGLLVQGKRICVTCYPAYMREDLGYRCTGTGLPNMETRWRALGAGDCQGRFRVISGPQQSCTCNNNRRSFVFV